jgi:hypothetical protein
VNETPTAAYIAETTKGESVKQKYTRKTIIAIPNYANPLPNNENIRKDTKIFYAKFSAHSVLSVDKK